MSLKLEDILEKEDELIALGHVIKEAKVEAFDITIQGHFGNEVTVNMYVKDRYRVSSLFHMANQTYTLGHLIQAIADIFDVDAENGLDLRLLPQSLNNRGFCAVYDEREKTIVGFGSRNRNKFVLIEHLSLYTRSKLIINK